MSAEVFVSYRWGHASRDAVWRLASALKRRLGGSKVRVDIESQASGESLRARIQREIHDARVVVVAIHPDWVDAIPRLAQPDDLVRLEVEAALELGVPIVPVLLNGARPPVREELPPSAQALCDLHMFSLGEHANYEADVSELARAISRIIGGRFIRYVTWLANRSAWNIAFGLIILGGLMLFLSRVLDLHMFRFAAPLEVWLSGPQENRSTVTVMREAGVLMAWNWVVVIILVTPVMVLIASATLRQAKELLDGLQLRKMIVYVGEHGGATPATSRRIWESVARPTALWCQVFIAIAVVLGCVQWWQYSGQWYFRGYREAAFMQTSTGPDWHVGWALGVESLAGAGGTITVFALAMYLVYGIGSALTFSYYAFLFNFFSEMTQISSAAGTRSSVVLRLDLRDRIAGGLGAFGRMQRGHAAFCYWSVFAMYLMALRNAYLPLTCRMPAETTGAASSLLAVAENCASMGVFATAIVDSFRSFISSAVSGSADLRVLFHTYSEQNLFVLGSMLHALLIAAFFYLISSRMRSIVESARGDAHSEVAAHLVRNIQFENARVLVILMLGAVSTVFLNLGPFVILVAVALWVLERLVVRAPKVMS